jgi:hypothetical protein
MTTKTKASMSLGLVTGLGAAVLPLSSYAAGDTESAEVRVTVAEAITITGINNQALGLNFSAADVSGGTVKTGTHAVTVSTNAAAGYALTMGSDTAELTKLTNDSGQSNVYGGAVGFSGIGAGAVVNADSGAAYNEATLTTGVEFAAGAPSTGAWGYRLGGWAANKYVSVPTTASPVTIAASNAPVTAKETTVTFGAQAGTSTPTGTYGAWLSYVATTK